MALVVASSHYEHTLDDAAGLPDLDAQQAELCRERFRRVDRFILLALIGSAACARAGSLRSGCGLYVSSSAGPLSSNVQVQEQMLRQHVVPKPFQFVNTLGSAVGYYLARNLDLGGHSTFVSRRGGAFLSALTLASADLACGAVPQALVGSVDECVLPLAASRAMFGLAIDAPVAEASTWVLLDPDQLRSPGRQLQIARLAGWEDARARLAQHLTPRDVLAFGPRVDETASRALLRALAREQIADEPVASASLDAARIGRHLEHGESGALYVVGPGGRTLATLAAR